MNHNGRNSRPALFLLIGAALLLCAAVFPLSGCGTANPYAAGSFERGERYFESGKHQEAADSFGQFLRSSPTDSLAPQAQMMKARSYMALEEYPMAAVELQILRQEYPTSDLLEEAAFLEAESHYLQIGRMERDISEAYVARDLLNRYLIAYPVSSRSPEARDYLRRISNLVVSKTLKNINVYRQLKRWRAVTIALDRCIEDETDSDLRDKLYWQRYMAGLKLDGEDDPTRFLQMLIDEYPESKRADEARSLLADLETPPGP